MRSEGDKEGARYEKFEEGEEAVEERVGGGHLGGVVGLLR